MGILKCRRGAISVFLIIVFTALLVLAGAIIDAARIMIAENRVQGALNSAVRSTLAGYHANLTGEFGLYGVYGKPEETNRYFLVNMQERHNNLNLIRYNIKQDVEVEYNTGLLDNEQFKEQILQYMKYKAPLAVTENLLEKLAGSGLGKKTEVMTLGQKTVEIRAGLKAEIAALNSKIINVLPFLSKKAVEMSPRSILDTIGEMERIIRNLDTVLEPKLKEYENAVQELNSRSEGVEQKPLPETVTLRQKINDLREKVQKNINILKRIEILLAKLHEAENDNLLSDLDRENKISRIKSQIESLQALLEEAEQISLPTQDLGAVSRKEIDEAGRIKEYIQKKLKLEKMNQDDLIPGDVFAAAHNANSEKFGEQMPELDEKGDYLMSEGLAVTEGRKITSFLSSLSRKVDELVSGTRNSLYIAEYVLDKFTYLTSSTARDHHFKKGEVEYILCGDNSEIKNVINVFGRIWFLRFALNTLYSFLESPMPHPLARLAYSLMEGLLKASMDMCDLYKGKKVPLFPEKIKSPGSIASPVDNISDKPSDILRLGYSDHLLIFLLLQDEETQLNRVRNLIQVNLRKMKDEPEFKLENCRTVCRAKVEVEINLWFAPVLHLDKLGWDRFKDGKYLIVCESVVGFDENIP